MSTPLQIIHSILGNYENHTYDNTSTKNDWHYVTISQVNDTTLKWSNRAGVSWTLTTTLDNIKLAVGSDCPYFSGHKQVTVIWEGDRVTGLLGPGDELYARTTEPAQPKKFIFVLAGQSNMYGGSGEQVGQEDWRNNTVANTGGVTAQEKSAEELFDSNIRQKSIPGRVKYWQVNSSGQGEFVNLDFDGINKEKMQMHSPNAWALNGPTLGVYFAAEFLLQHNDPAAEVYLVGNAVPTTGFNLVTPDLAGETSTWSTSLVATHKLQDYMRWHATNAANAVPDAEIAGLLWLQGESDYQMTASDYATAVQAMVYQFRVQVPRALNAPFYLATMMPQNYSNPALKMFSSNVDEAHRTIIPFYNQQQGTGVFNTRLIDTIDMKDQQKFQKVSERSLQLKTHYSSFALRQIGKRFAASAVAYRR